MAMIPYTADPSLHPAEPTPEQLDDGCSPPTAGQAAPKQPVAPGGAEPVDPTLWAKSEF